MTLIRVESSRVKPNFLLKVERQAMPTSKARDFHEFASGLGRKASQEPTRVVHFALHHAFTLEIQI